MKKSPLLWIFRRVRRRIPAIAVMTLAQVGQAVFAVLFALGSRGVIDSAVAGDPDAFVDPAAWKAFALERKAFIGAMMEKEALT